MSCGYFIAFAVIFAYVTIYPVQGQSTVQRCDIGDSSISIEAEIQQQRFLIEQSLALQKLHSTSFQQMISQHEIIMRNLQAVDQRLDDHDIYIKNQTDINMRSLQAVNQRFGDHIKNQTDIIMRNLQAVDRRLHDHDVYMKNQSDINMRSLQAVDRRLHDHDVYMKNQSDMSMRNLQAVDRRLQGHDVYMKNQSDMSMRNLQAVDRHLQDHDTYVKKENSRKLANDVSRLLESQIRDCSDIRASGHNESGVYQVHVIQPRQFSINAFCDMETINGKWLVFQRRKDGSQNFNRTWSEYAAGFGDPSGEFWLGNEMLHLLTSKRNYRLRIDLEDFEGQRRYAEYSSFVVSSSADNYTLTIGNYSGNAGDSLSYHNRMQFSTRDVDHDSSSMHCAQHYSGAWWHGNCYYSILNGIYGRGNKSLPLFYGVIWEQWHGFEYSLKTTEMKFAPVP